MKQSRNSFRGILIQQGFTALPHFSRNEAHTRYYFRDGIKAILRRTVGSSIEICTVIDGDKKRYFACYKKLSKYLSC